MRTRRLVGAVALGSVGAAVAHQRCRRAWARAPDPCGPEGMALPAGDEHKVVTDDGAVLSATVAGPAGGPPVLLAHCFLCTRDVWGGVARRLVAGGHRVLLYDHRGHGTSTLGAEPLTIGRLGTDVRVVLEHFGLEDAVLAGHSIGGMAAQAFAVDHPEVVAQRLRGLVLVATSARPSPMPTTSTTVERILGEHALRMPEATIGHAAVRGAFGRASPPAPHLEYVRARVGATMPAARVEGAVAISHMDLRQRLGAVAVPTTVVAGGLDLLLPPYHARSLVRHLPGARLELLPGVGHMVPMEAPDQLSEVIAGHVSS